MSSQEINFCPRKEHCGGQHCYECGTCSTLSIAGQSFCYTHYTERMDPNYSVLKELKGINIKLDTILKR